MLLKQKQDYFNEFLMYKFKEKMFSISQPQILKPSIFFSGVQQSVPVVGTRKMVE